MDSKNLLINNLQNHSDFYSKKIIEFANKVFDESSTKDIIEICNKLNLKIEYLEFERQDTTKSRILGKLVSINISRVSNYDEISSHTIYVEKKTPYRVKKFCIAHELAHFLLNQELVNKDTESKIYTDAQFSFPDITSVDSEEIIADDIATALLVPEIEFLEEIEKLKQEFNASDVSDMDGLFLKLSNEFQVPFYVIISAYQLYRNIGISNN